MADKSNIEWTDSTFNPWIGCTKVSPACEHCYAEVSTPSRTRSVKWGAGQPRQRTSAGNWAMPLRWNAKPFYECAQCGWRGDDPEGVCCPICRNIDGIIREARRRVFTASLADWLDNEVPVEWLVDLLDLIRRTPNLDWLLLTKRIGNWEARLTVAHQHVVKTMGGGTSEYAAHPLWALGMWIQDWIAGTAPANVWIGATICNQAEADRDVPKLLRVPAAVRFLSVEPMLGPIKIHPALIETIKGTSQHGQRFIDWIIAGGESGLRARPMHPDWARSLRDQCAAADVPFLFKQWGEWLPSEADDQPIYRGEHRYLGGAWHAYKVGKKAAGRLLDGVTHDGYPVVRHG